MKNRSAFVALMVGWTCSAAWAAPAENPGQQAKTFQESVLSRYIDRKYKEAAELLEDFNPKFSTNENIPANLCRLAHCYAEIGQWDKFDIPLDDCIKRFHGSRYWFQAYAFKLERLKDLKDGDKYLTAAEAMIKKNEEVPFSLGFTLREAIWGLRSSSWHEMFRAASPVRPLSVADDWGRDLVQICDTPERAARALKMIQKLLDKKRHEIPLEWQYAHVALLALAGEAEKSDQILAQYVDLLEKEYKDFRVVSLLDLRAELARRMKDEKAEAAVVQKLMKDYPACVSAAEPLHERIVALAKAGKYDEFAPLARHFVKTFPIVYPHNSTGSPREGSVRWMAVVREWMKLATDGARAGNLRPATDLLALIEEVEKGKSPYIPEQMALNWKYNLLVALARYPEAAKIGAQLLSDAWWSGGNFAMLEKDAARHESLKTVVEDARKKRRVPAKDPSSPAAAMLKTLDAHLKEGKERMADEVATEMWEKHKDDAHTIEAMSKISDYYYKKVLAEPRDKWANRMIEAYPQHPLTHGVFNNQINAEVGQRNYDRVGAIIDSAATRFPGAVEQWEDQRVSAFLAKQDPNGATAYLRRLYAKRLEAGDPLILDRIHAKQTQPIRNIDEKAAGDEWAALAKKLAGTPAEPYCLLRAYLHYYERVYSSRDKKDIQWEPALAAVRALRAQTTDPEVAWQTGFTEANILAWKLDSAGAARAVSEQLKEGKQRDLSLRLDMARMGAALGKLPKPEDGAALAKKIAGICVTPRDAVATLLLQASVWNSAQKPATASPLYLGMVYGNPNPATMFPFLRLGLAGLTPQQYNAEVAKFMKEAPNAQDVIPELLFKWYHDVKDSQPAARKMLVEKYPTSEARDTLQDQIEAAQKPKPAPPKK